MNNASMSSLTLGGTEIHLWSIFLDDAYKLARENLLSPDERARSRRYLIPQARLRFVACRVMLRLILAEYLHVEPGALCFQYSRYGKPALGGPWSDHPLRFNLSHSENFLTVAVTWERQVGIDVEYVRPVPDADTIAADYFSPAEYTLYQNLSLELKPQAFLNYWTRKEAYIKACGDRLAVPLSGFEVTFLPGEPTHLVRAAENDLQQWEMYTLALPLGYTGALVVELIQTLGYS
jgi:4'-phosphopantetheinyl transferase